MSEYGLARYIDSMRDVLRDHALAQLRAAWASMAIEQGADRDDVAFDLMAYNIKGGK